MIVLEPSVAIEASKKGKGPKILVVQNEVSLQPLLFLTKVFKILKF